MEQPFDDYEVPGWSHGGAGGPLRVSLAGPSPPVDDRFAIDTLLVFEGESCLSPRSGLCPEAIQVTVVPFFNTSLTPRKNTSSFSSLDKPYISPNGLNISN
jgi:hypothetical protein